MRLVSCHRAILGNERPWDKVIVKPLSVTELEKIAILTEYPYLSTESVF